MVYTLALQLKELIAEMIVKRKERIAREDEERYRREEEVRGANLGAFRVSRGEELLTDVAECRVSLRTQAAAAKKRGTPVTKESFAAWSAKFEAEYAAQLKREEEERIRALPPKEREEARRWAAKLTGACAVHVGLLARPSAAESMSTANTAQPD